MEHSCAARALLMPFGLHATAWNICRTVWPFYGRDRAFQLLIIVMALLQPFLLRPRARLRRDWTGNTHYYPSS